MAATVRVVLRMTLGEPWRRLSDEEKRRLMDRLYEVHGEWKEDPGIRFLCYYGNAGGGYDGFAHHWIFEVDDASKVLEMKRPIGLGKIGPLEKFSFEVVWGNTEIDDFWGS